MKFCCFICVTQWWAVHVVIKRQFLHFIKCADRYRVYTLSLWTFSLFCGLLLHASSVYRTYTTGTRCPLCRSSDLWLRCFWSSGERQPETVYGRPSAGGSRPSRSVGWHAGRAVVGRTLDEWVNGGDRTPSRNHRSTPLFISAQAAANRAWSVAAWPVDDHCSAGKSSSKPISYNCRLCTSRLYKSLTLLLVLKFAYINYREEVFLNFEGLSLLFVVWTVEETEKVLIFFGFMPV